jgi:hypothetical protein
MDNRVKAPKFKRGLPLPQDSYLISLAYPGERAGKWRRGRGSPHLQYSESEADPDTE